MQGHRLQSAVLGEARHVYRHQLVVVPSGAKLHGEGDRNRRPDLGENPFHQAQVAEAAGAAIALGDLAYGAAEVDIEDVESQVLADGGGFGHHVRIGAEKLRGDRMLFGSKCQIFQRPGGLFLPRRCAYAVRAGEFRHDEAATAQAADEAAKNRVGDTGHGGEDRRRSDRDTPDGQCGWKVLNHFYVISF
jgi:hypothetical protein